MQGSKKDGTIVEGNKQLNEKRIHPTQKPIRLYEWLLMKYANRGDKILDTHIGSRSIALACHYLPHLDLNLTGCEIDKEYFDDGEKRFNELTAQTFIPIE